MELIRPVRSCTAKNRLTSAAVSPAGSSEIATTSISVAALPTSLSASEISPAMSGHDVRPLDTPTGDAFPLVFTHPWHSNCLADPRHLVPGGETQPVDSGASNHIAIVRQPIVRFPIRGAQQLTFCGDVVQEPSPGVATSFVVARTQTSRAVLPPRGRSPGAFNQGRWRVCAADAGPDSHASSPAPTLARAAARRPLARTHGSPNRAAPTTRATAGTTGGWPPAANRAS